MKKLKLVVPLLLLTALVLTGAMCEEERKRKKEKDDEDEEEEELKDYALYENEKWNFEIYHPDDWGKEILVDDLEGIAIDFVTPAESPEDYFLEDVVVASMADPYENFDELMTEIINEIEEDEYWEIVSYSEKMIGGYPAYEITYREKYYEEEVYYLHYFINGGNAWYQILYAAEGEDKYDKYLKQVETMIDSFKIRTSPSARTLIRYCINI